MGPIKFSYHILTRSFFVKYILTINYDLLPNQMEYMHFQIENELYNPTMKSNLE